MKPFDERRFDVMEARLLATWQGFVATKDRHKLKVVGVLARKLAAMQRLPNCPPHLLPR